MDSFDDVIVGGGPAGLSAIQSIREVDRKASLLWISDEPYLPYSKVLLPYLLSGKIKEANLMLIDQQSLENLGVTLWTKSPVLSLDVGKKSLEVKKGKEVAFNKLLIASGASPVFPKIPGIKTKGVFGLRTLNDVRQMTQGVGKKDKVVIWGGGLVGTQAANALYLRGIRSSLLVSSPHILSQILDSETAKVVQKKIGKQGPTLYLKEDITEIQSKDGRISSVVLKSGKKLKTNLLIVGKGVKPNIDFLMGSKIGLDRGVLVDQRMTTNIPDIYAAGDVAVDIDLLSGKRSHVAIWPKAIDEGRVAGRNMAGEEMIYPGTLSMNITTIFGMTIAVVGNTRSTNSKQETLIFRGKKVYRKIFLRDNQIMGLVFIGNYFDAGVLSNFIRSRIPFDRIGKEYKGEPIRFNQIYEEIMSELGLEA
jgi:NAD(P)H-nitrite reductase large subunit